MLSYKATNRNKANLTGLVICFLLAFFFVFSNFSASDTDKDMAYAADYADSMLSWENHFQKVPVGITAYLIHMISTFADCAERTMILSRSDLKNVCIPEEIGEDAIKDECASYEANSNYVGGFLSLALMIAIVIGALAFGLVTSFIGIGWLILAMVGVQVVMSMSSCNNFYILAPHEYINEKEEKMVCSSQNGEVINVYKDDAGKGPALTQLDVPFFYQCSRPGKYGYLGDVACANEMIRNYGTKYEQHIGSIFVRGNKTLYATQDTKGEILCQVRNPDTVIFTKDDVRNNRRQTVLSKGILGGDSKTKVATYYRFHGGRVQLCAYVVGALNPMRIGCTYVPPPIERYRPLDDQVANYISNTRCAYFVTNRLDLKALGIDLSKRYRNNSVAMFLSSDMHFTSTVVGCIEDLLSQIMVYGVGMTQENFMQRVQAGLKQVVLLILAIYVIMSAIKLLSSPQVPQKAEWIMMLIRFALVLFFTTSNIWYGDPKAEGGPDNSIAKNGLYSSIINAVPSLIDVFMQSTSAGDPFAMCTLRYPGAGDNNILSERLLPAVVSPFSGDGTQNNVGYTTTPSNINKSYIKLTVWDYLDCKIANYLNLGNCNYSITGMLAFMFIPLSLFMGIKGLIFAMASALYLVLIMMVVFRFVHITILSLFLITVLVLVAPLMICFSLFEYTKQTFQSWMRMLLGYIIYPALLFSFLSLMVVTFDTLFYGDDKAVAAAGANCASGTEACSIKYNDLCPTANQENPSVYCALISQQKIDTIKRCENFSTSFVWANIGEEGTIINYLFAKIFGFSKSITKSALDLLFGSMVKLALFALMFYLFLSYVMDLMSAISQAYDAASFAKGSVNIGGIIGNAWGKGMSLGASGIAGMIKGKGADNNVRRPGGN